MNYNEVLANARENIGKLCKGLSGLQWSGMPQHRSGSRSQGCRRYGHSQLPEVAGDQSEYGYIVCAEGSGYIP